MKKFKLFWPALIIFLLLVSFLSWNQAYAQTAQIDLRNGSSAAEVKVNNFQNTKIDFTFHSIRAIDIKTEQGTFSELTLDRGYSIGELGVPKLPAEKHLIQIPFGANVEVEVIKYTTSEYRLSDFGINYPLMPVQASLRKDQDPSQVPFEFKAESYTKNSFTENPIAQVEILGVLRGMRIARLTIAPVSYNPVEQTVKVYNDIEVEIRYPGADIALTNHIRASTYSPYFDVVYSKILNYKNDKGAFDDHPDLTKNPMKMIVVSNRIFEEALQPFLEWKTQQGFFLTVAYTDEIGTSATAIKNYIHAQYNAATPEDPAPTFLLLVGDRAKLPESTIGSSSGKVTDLYYASVDGDQFPEMYYGRLSASNVQQLQNQLNKILYYEKYEFEDPSYLNDATLIAGADSYWNPRLGQPAIHYATQNYFNTAHGFNTVNTYLTNYSGCYDNARISVSFINYTAHCGPTSWGDPLLSVSMVHNMTNAGKYPLAVGNCCMSGDFGYGSESVGEAWVRAQNKGSVAYIGSAPNTYWFEDFYWVVGAFPLQGSNEGYIPSVEESSIGAFDAPFISDYVAVGAIQFVGNLAVTEVHLQNYPSHSSPLYYWQAYHTFGDPSTFIYLSEGEENQVSHMPIVPIGLDTYTVNALPGSYVAVSMNGVLHGAGFVDETGELEVPIEPILDGGDVRIVVTKYQYIPYIVDIPAAALEGPFIVLDSYVINDEEGNGNGLAEYGENLSLHLTLKNVGADPIDEVFVTLLGEDPYFNLVNPDEPVVFEGMEAGDEDNTSTVENAFSLQVDYNIPNEHKATFLVKAVNDEEEWISNLRITAYAPVFSIDPVFTIDDSESGDNNNQLDPGETALITFNVKNNGGATANHPEISLQADSPYLTITQNNIELAPISPGETVEVPFELTAHPSTIEGTFVNLDLEIEDGHLFDIESVLVIGQVPEAQIGQGNIPSTSYPFYNYYKANRTQMLYRASELGSSEKVITELGLNISQVANNYRDLPNFKILIKPTTQTSLTAGSYYDMTGATEVFSASSYAMPQITGWHIWDIQNFIYDGESNLVIEFSWGLLSGYTSTYYRVACTSYPVNLVAFGYSDTQYSPNYHGISGTRPNLFMAFAVDQAEDTQEVTFVAKANDLFLENVAVKIGSAVNYTETDGTTSFSLLPGTYEYTATSGILEPLTGTIEVVDEAIEIILNFIPLFTVNFTIDDTWGNEVNDAVITIDNEAYGSGVYSIVGLPEGNYTYTVSRESYLEFTDSFEILDEDLVIQVTLTPDGTSITEYYNGLNLEAYPNPTHGPLTLRVNTGGESVVITMTNYQGQIINQEELSPRFGETELNFNLSSYASGIYYIKAETESQTLIRKIIVH